MGKDKTEKASTSDRIAWFLQKHRKVLLALVIIMVSGVALSVAYFIVRGVMEKKAIAKVEVFEQRINDLGITDENAKSAEVEALLEEINSFAQSSFGYAAARSYSLAADIYFSRSEWKMAEESWVLSAGKAPKIYLYPLSLFNAAVAAEEQGMPETAIDYYNKSLEFSGIYPAAARARFNIARLHEERKNTNSALDAYRELIEKNPDSPWANLAHNRLIVLEKN